MIEVDGSPADFARTVGAARVIVGYLTGLSAIPPSSEGAAATLCAFVLVGPDMSWPLELERDSFVRAVEMIDGPKPLVFARATTAALWSLFRALDVGEDLPRVCSDAERWVASHTRAN